MYTHTHTLTNTDNGPVSPFVSLTPCSVWFLLPVELCPVDGIVLSMVVRNLAVSQVLN